jgi:hypothetical protein
VSLAILPVCQTCLHFQFWSAFGPKHGITGLGYTRPMYRWIMDPRVSAEPLKGNRSGAGQRWDGMMSGMLEPCYKALDRTLRLLVSLISNIFTPFQTTDIERRSPIRDIFPLSLTEVSYIHPSNDGWPFLHSSCSLCSCLCLACHCRGQLNGIDVRIQRCDRRGLQHTCERRIR